MRWLALLVLPALLLAAACNGDGDGDGSSTATIEAGGTPGAEAFGEEGFRRFVPLLQDALDRQDVAFFRDRALTSPVVCEAEDLEGGLGKPECERVGQSYDGLGVGYWGEGGGDVPVEKAIGLIESLLGSVLPDASDDFGDGALRVYALNVSNERFDAIVTAIVETPEDLPGQGPQRVVLGFSWAGAEGRWMTTGFVTAREDGAADLLTPSEQVRDIFYPYWERYED